MTTLCPGEDEAWGDDEKHRESVEAPCAASSSELLRPAPGETIGRYVVMHRLARGGTGVVHAAYDPELDRKVALKLLDRHEGQRSSDARIAEAQAMARLTHPNVVAVYDVGTHEGRVFIAMEYVAGRNLRKLMHGRRMPWPEALRALVPAGHGLAAAHAAGVVHRDFKPENVLIGDDGRVCVVDFGIAMPAKRVRNRRAADATPSASSDATDVTGPPLAGTVAYMAPEQFVQSDVDVRSDQFAFCSVLFEALSGRPPHATTFAARRQELLCRSAPAWPPEIRVPRWLRRAIERGLCFNPDGRFPSMDALLQALRRGPRWRRLGIGTGVTGCVVVLAGVGALLQKRAEPTPCAGMERHLEGIWDEPTKARLREHAAPSETSLHVEAMLDDYADRWVTARTRTCVATHVTGEQSQARMDAQLSCLDKRLVRFAALVGRLAEADDDQALTAVAALPGVASCAHDDELALLALPEDEGQRARLEGLREAIAGLEAGLDLAMAPPSEAAISAILEEARAVGHPPLVADALLASARIARNAGKLEAAEEAAAEALAVGGRAKQEHLIARAWLSLLTTLAHSPHRAGEFERVAMAAELATLRDADPQTRLELLTELGIGLGRQGRFEEARMRFEEALDWAAKTPGTPPLKYARVANNLGATLERLGVYVAAAREHARAIELVETVLGPDHPEIASPLTNLGSVYAALFDHETAVNLHARAIEILEVARGADHPSLVPPLVNAGFALIELQRHTEAQEQLMRAVVIGEQSLGPSHPILSYALVGLGRILVEHERHGDALLHLERADALLGKHDTDHNLRGELRFSLARAVAATHGDFERAHQLCQAATEDFTTSGTAADRLEAIGRWLAENTL